MHRWIPIYLICVLTVRKLLCVYISITVYHSVQVSFGRYKPETTVSANAAGQLLRKKLKKF